MIRQPKGDKPRKPWRGQMILIPTGDGRERCKTPMGSLAVEARRGKRSRRRYVCLDCFVEMKKEDEAP